MSNDKKTVYQKLMNVQHKLKAPKNQWNKFGNYRYRSCEDILEAAKPLAYEEKALITFSTSIKPVEGRFYVFVTAEFTDTETGECITKEAPAREEEMKKGMDGSQITGSSMSYAKKYALGNLLAIDDTKDSDATNTHGKDKEEFTKAKSVEATKSRGEGLSDAQLRRLYTIANSSGINRDTVKEHVFKRFKKEPRELTRKEYDIVVEGYESMR